MPVEPEVLAEYRWPRRYHHDGALHDWDDLVPDEDGGTDPEYTYRDLVFDEAAARGYGREVQTWLELNVGRQVGSYDPEDQEDAWEN
jgi:hypothetical protein